MTAFSYAERTPRLSDLRAYLVGVGATAALTAGALVVFLSLATFLAFHGLPFGGSSDDDGAVYLDSTTSAAPAVAAAALGPALAKRGLLLVGLDVIGDWLTEINVTSPTCFREIQDQTGFDVSGMFLDALEKKIK